MSWGHWASQLRWQKIWGPKGTTRDRDVVTTMAGPWIGEVYSPFIYTGALEGISRQDSLQRAFNH